MQNVNPVLVSALFAKKMLIEGTQAKIIYAEAVEVRTVRVLI